MIISKIVAQKVDREADYSKSKGFSKQFICDLILKALDEHEGLTKAKIDELVFDYLPRDMSEEKKTWRVGYLLSSLKKEGKIFSDESRTWRLIHK